MGEKKSGVCGKCDGRGRIDAFSHYAGGVCFWCNGSGVVEWTESSPVEPVQGVEPVIGVKVDGEVMIVACWPSRAFEVSVRAPERADRAGNTCQDIIGNIFFGVEGRVAVASDGMIEEGRRMSADGKRALFAAAAAVHRQATLEGSR